MIVTSAHCLSTRCSFLKFLTFIWSVLIPRRGNYGSNPGQTQCSPIPRQVHCEASAWLSGFQGQTNLNSCAHKRWDKVVFVCLWVRPQWKKQIPSFLSSRRWCKMIFNTERVAYKHTHTDVMLYPHLSRQVVIFSPLPLERKWKQHLVEVWGTLKMNLWCLVRIRESTVRYSWEN